MGVHLLEQPLVANRRTAGAVSCSHLLLEVLPVNQRLSNCGVGPRATTVRVRFPVIQFNLSQLVLGDLSRVHPGHLSITGPIQRHNQSQSHTAYF